MQKKTDLLRKKLKVKTDRDPNENPNREIGHLIMDCSVFILRVGFSCENRCIHCFVENRREVKDLTTEELKYLIDSIPKFPDKQSIVIVTGGEPTIRKDLPELLRYLKEHGHVVELETHGMKFADEVYLKNLLPYIDGFFIPVHSFDPNIHDAITMVNGSWEKTIQGLKNIYQTDIHTINITVLNQLNYKGILETQDFIQSIAPKTLMSITFPHAIGAAHSSKIVPRFNEIRPYLFECYKKWGPLILTHYIPQCYVFPYLNTVSTLDSLELCRLGIDYINDEWAVAEYDKIDDGAKIKSAECITCKFDPKCNGIWRDYLDLYNNFEAKPVPNLSIPFLKRK